MAEKPLTRYHVMGQKSLSRSLRDRKPHNLHLLMVSEKPKTEYRVIVQLFSVDILYSGTV